MLLENERQCGCLDLPDPQDYDLERMGYASAEPLKDFVDLKNFFCLDQLRDNSCTSHALAHVIMIMLTMRYKEKITASAASMWTNQFQYPGTASLKGDYLLSALKSAKHFGVKVLVPSINKWITIPIESYGRLRSDSEVYEVMSNRYPVFTGVPWYFKGIDSKGYWQRTRSLIGGHAGCCAGYNKEKTVFMPNSYGESWRKVKGRPGDYLLKEENIDALMSKYILRLDFNKIDDIIHQAK